MLSNKVSNMVKQTVKQLITTFNIVLIPTFTGLGFYSLLTYLDYGFVFRGLISVFLTSNVACLLTYLQFKKTVLECNQGDVIEFGR